MPERKIEIVLNPDTDPDNQDTPYSYVVLEWGDGPCLWNGPNSDQSQTIMPGTENGCWHNTGVCGWEATLEQAFAKALERSREKWGHEGEGKVELVSFEKTPGLAAIAFLEQPDPVCRCGKTSEGVCFRCGQNMG